MNCPKCGNNYVIGPRYEKTLWGTERLVYRCACGYRWYEACLDAKREDPRWVPSWARRSPQTVWCGR
jgi:hypothetical protein